MSRWVPGLILACGLCAAGQLKQERKQPSATQHQVPPEEDESVAVKEYSFNPLQAQKEVETGNFYFKKGNYKAAAFRFKEATKWNSGFADAWLRLGEAEEKRKDFKAAKAAYQKYLELAPDAHNAAEVKKKVAKLK